MTATPGGPAVTSLHVRAVGAAESLEGRVGDGGHLPSRPDWSCLGCKEETPWPCDTARMQLAEAYRPDRISLLMYLGELRFLATYELPTVSPAELFERFAAWAR